MSMNHRDAILVQAHDTRDSLLAMFDELIQLRPNAERQDLNTLRNTFSITYKLPDEVLSEIFVLLQIKYNKLGRFLSPRKRFKGWNGVTHISQRWRNVAVECTKLWHNINEDLPLRAIPAFFKRSRGRGLFVDLYGYLLRPSIFRQILSQNLRIERLDVTFTATNHTTLLPLLLSIPTPRLKQLSINNHGPSDLTLPDNLFQGVTPLLDTLSVACCYLNLKSTVSITNLTTFKLSDLDDLPIEAPTALLDAFRQMPGLQHLILHKVWSIDRRLHVSENVDVVYLPNLLTLACEGERLSSDLGFFSHLRFPAQTALKFVSNSGAYGTSLPVPLLSFLQTHSRSRSAGDVPRVWRMILKRTQVEAKDPHAICLVVLGHDDIENPLDIDVIDGRGPWGYLNILLFGRNCEELVCDQPLMAEITSLHFPNITSFSVNCEVKLEGWAIETLFIVLGGSKAGSYPMLQILHLYKTVPIKFETAFVQALQRRRDIELPIREIWLTRCVALYKAFLGRLESFVTMVNHCDWCGLMETGEYDDEDWCISDDDYEYEDEEFDEEHIDTVPICT